jgi:hypothetical protein
MNPSSDTVGRVDVPATRSSIVCVPDVVHAIE